MTLEESDKKALLDIAKKTVESYIRERCIPSFSVDSQALLEKRGAFVSIYKKGRLRGCIGTFYADKALYETVVDMALASSTKDIRFMPIETYELNDITIELSVLTPLREITDMDEIEIGRHGIYIAKGSFCGVLLPQVAVEYGFDRDTFLNQTCLKAGLPEGCWRDGAKVFVFEAEVFGQKKT